MNSLLHRESSQAEKAPRVETELVEVNSSSDLLHLVDDDSHTRVGNTRSHLVEIVASEVPSRLDEEPPFLSSRADSIPEILRSVSGALELGLTDDHDPVDDHVVLRSETKHLLRLAFPAMLGAIGAKTMSLVDLYFVGHLGPSYVAAVAMAQSVTWSTLVFAIGITFALDTFVSQAHGAQNTRLAKLWLQRSIVVSLGLFAILCIPWAFTEHILLGIGQEPEIARLAGQYVWYLVPGLLPTLLFGSVRRYLQCMSIVRPAVFATIVVNILNVIFNWVFVGMYGFKGAALATTLSRTFMLLLVVVLARDPLRLHWSRACLQRKGLVEYLAKGVPTACALALELFAFVIAMNLSGFINKDALAAQGIIMDVASFMFMIPVGISTAGSARIGQMLGKGCPRKARAAARLSLRLALVSGFVFSTVYIGAPRQIAGLFVASEGAESVIDETTKALRVLAIFNVCDTMQTVAGGVFRGVGQPKPALVGHLIGNYVIGLPVGAFLAFYADLGLGGLWLGLSAGMAGAYVLLFLKLQRLPWDDLADDARRRSLHRSE